MNYTHRNLRWMGIGMILTCDYTNLVSAGGASEPLPVHPSGVETDDMVMFARFQGEDGSSIQWGL